MPDIGGADYNNFSLYGQMPGFFPNAGWGGPSSPAYQMAAPRDYMARSNQYAGNSSYAPPGGINFGSPMTNLIGGLAIQGMFGPNVRPFQKPDLPDMDYLRAKIRNNESFSRLRGPNSIYGEDSRWLEPRVGQGLANSNLFQSAFDLINPGGSQKGAFDMIYGRLGTSFGGDLSSQANTAQKALRDINSEFRIKSGPNAGGFDFNRSFGFDREQIAEQLDVGARYGIGGLSGRKVADATRTGDVGRMARDNARVFGAAQQVFGKDKGMEELAQLMTKSIDGFQGLDATKATDLLNKIQSTSRAVNISTKAFAEYATMFNDLYKSTGMGGASAAGHIMDSAMRASVATELGRKTGDAGLSDQNATMDAQGRNRLDLMRSPTMKKATALAAKMANMTDSQLAAVQVAGVGSLADLKNGGLQKLLESGDTESLEKVLTTVNQSSDSLLGGKGSLDRRARNLSENDRQDASRIVNTERAGAFNARNAIKKFGQNLSRNGQIDQGLLDAAGGAGGLTDLMEQFSSVKEAGSLDSVMSKFNDDDFLQANPRIAAMSKDDRERFAEQFSSNFREQAQNGPALRRYGYQSPEDFNADFALASKPGRKMLDEKYTQTRKDKGLQTFLGELTGDTLKDFGVRESAGVVLDLMKDIAGGKAVDKDGKPIEMAGIRDKDGKFDLQKVLDLAKSKGKSVTKVDQMKDLLGTLDQKSIDDIDKTGQDAYDSTLLKTKGRRDLAEDARNDAIRAKATPLIDKFNDVPEMMGPSMDDWKKGQKDLQSDDPSSAKNAAAKADGGGVGELAKGAIAALEKIVTAVETVAKNTEPTTGADRIMTGARAARKTMDLRT